MKNLLNAICMVGKTKTVTYNPNTKTFTEVVKDTENVSKVEEVARDIIKIVRR